GLIALPVYAQELTYGTATFEIEALEDKDQGIDYDIMAFDGAFEYQINQFVLGGALAGQSIEASIGLSQDLRRIGGFAAYQITPEILVGLGFDDVETKIDNGFGDFTIQNDVVSGFAQYQNENFGVAVARRNVKNESFEFDVTSYFGEVRIGDNFTAGAVVEAYTDSDEQIYHLSADFVSGPWAARGFYTSASYLDGGYFGLRGEYTFGSGVAVIAGYDDSSDDLFIGDFSSASIAANYQFNDALSAQATYKLFQLGNDDEVQSLGVTLDYQFGMSKRLDEKMYRAIRDDLSQSPAVEQPNYGYGMLFSFFGVT
uniref:hypothetical protein n=1 Tax=Yoonia sp. TaxID=2212373 RepID=UPI0035C79C79